MFLLTGHLHSKVVNTLDSQYRVPDSNPLDGFAINVISAFHSVEAY